MKHSYDKKHTQYIIRVSVRELNKQHPQLPFVLHVLDLGTKVNNNDLF